MISRISKTLINPNTHNGISISMISNYYNKRFYCNNTTNQNLFSNTKSQDHQQHDINTENTIITPQEKRKIIERIIRVDHAGEFGAARIYEGQLAVLGNTSEGPLIREMADQEKQHQAKFNELIYEHRVRPTALSPIWNIAGFGLGYVSALMGKEAAMAVTVAVEEVISEHYNDQLRKIHESNIDNQDLKDTIKKFRDDEMEHMHIGLKHDAELAPLYKPLSELVKLGTKSAIWLSTRV
ncbi:ubiquinone biosynthesis protein [Tieghemostelium lacteum]|uniref:5-demethoxyubiquinone hydroxylase, mitochondrial n=1 Tax=Tieghemostelium lacteum TaxID=361077 RepID=A0A151Z9E9_TIELA|nr:ubiquinone biosynthesis protein [Tieghemostelium lacteum]|eukprot:KYQ90581.1 ubiquinone biosynthesis protein [Tieghemostelium lacteum]